MKKEQKGGFLSMLLGVLGASLLANLLAVKGVREMGQRAITACDSVIKAGEGTIRAGQYF